MLTLERARSGRSMCRPCSHEIGNRGIQYGEWRVGMGRTWQHVECFMEQTGVRFMRRLIPLLSDEHLGAIGLGVEYPESEPEAPAHEFVLGDVVEPRVPGSTSSLGLRYGPDWVGEVIRAPFDHSQYGQVMEVRWTTGSTLDYYVPVNEMQLVSADTAEPDPSWWRSLRQGDRVRIVNNTSHPFMSGFNIGDEFEVLGIEGPSYNGNLPIHIIRSSTANQWVSHRCVERV